MYRQYVVRKRLETTPFCCCCCSCLLPQRRRRRRRGRCTLDVPFAAKDPSSPTKTLCQRAARPPNKANAGAGAWRNDGRTGTPTSTVISYPRKNYPYGKFILRYGYEQQNTQIGSTNVSCCVFKNNPIVFMLSVGSGWLNSIANAPHERWILDTRLGCRMRMWCVPTTDVLLLPPTHTHQQGPRCSLC
jgi:hypothetical protein